MKLGYIIIDNATNIQKALGVLNNLQTSVVNKDGNDADVNVLIMTNFGIICLEKSKSSLPMRLIITPLSNWPAMHTHCNCVVNSYCFINKMLTIG